MWLRDLPWCLSGCSSPSLWSPGLRREGRALLIAEAIFLVRLVSCGGTCSEERSIGRVRVRSGRAANKQTGVERAEAID